MKFPKTYALILLALTTIGGAGLAWQQYQELVALRAAGVDQDGSLAMQKRLAELERRNQELQDQLAMMQDGSGDVLSRAAAAAASGPPNRAGFQGGRGGRGGFQGGRGGPGGRGNQQAAMQAVLARPEVQALVAAQQKARLEDTYGNLFRNLNLTSALQDKVESLLIDRQATLQDVSAAARDQGINPRTDPGAFTKLIADAQNAVNNDLKSVIGDAGISQLQNYDQTMPERNVVNQLQQRLSYSDTPLTSTQAEQLVQILAANAPPQSGNGAANQYAGGRGGFGGGTVIVTPTAVSQAQGVLAGNQLAVLQQLQQQQQTEQQLRQILTAAESAARNANSGTTTTGASGGATNAAGATTTGGRRRGGG